MIEAVISRSVRHPFAILALAVLLLGGGVYVLQRMPVDAIPDLSDVQVIIKTTYPGQAPQVVEDQVTFPLTTSMLAVPGATAVRGISNFGDSYVHVLFTEDTDLYWARSRVLERLTLVQPRLPPSARTALGPDATGVGWVYTYALVDRTGNHDLAQLRSIQDWFLKYELQAVEGVAEVATVGGMVKEYEVVVDPERLWAYGYSIEELKLAIERGNQETGASVIEQGEADFVVRATGYIRGVDDLRQTVLDASYMGTPTLLGDLAEVREGPAPRLGVGELDGEGEAVGGIVVMRFSENALQTIQAVKQRLAELRASLPAGVEIVETYDRSGLVKRAIDTLRNSLIEEFVIVSLVCVVFLFHFRSSLVVMLSLPLGIAIAFIVMYRQGINANIMSLGGIAIAIGAMVDAAIVMIENAHKQLEVSGHHESRGQVILRAAQQVGPALFFSLLVITLSFLPVFALEAQEGRMFKPLAYTKTYAMAAAAGLAVTLVPVLMTMFIRGRILPEHRNPVNRWLMSIYRPALELALHRPRLLIAAAILATIAGLWPLRHLGTEFMPELDEGDYMYMPTTLPSISIGKAAQLLQQTDRLIRTVPEVQTVYGKIGRADTATDPAPINMIETLVRLKPRGQWRPGVTPASLRQELNAIVRLPGVANTWVMPIKARIDMVATGFKTPVGIKIAGPDLKVIEQLGREIEGILREMPGTASVYSDRVTGGRYVTIEIDRRRAARHALNIADIQDTIATAVGGMPVGESVEGRERYPISVRYTRETRDSVARLRSLPIGGSESRVPLGEVATIRVESGPDMIRSENGRPNGWVYIDTVSGDYKGYVEEARALVEERVALPAGYSLKWSGQYESILRATERLSYVVPATLILIMLLLYLNFGNFTEALIIMASLPFAMIGSLWLVYLMGYHLSVAVVIGFIALAGVAAETGVVMLVFLDVAYERYAQMAAAQGRGMTRAELTQAVVEGALLRLRPKVMTVCAIIGGLLPIMYATGTGSEVMRRIAAPMVGGMVTAAILTLLIIPAVYLLWRRRALPA
ncbi:MAG: Cation efflux system protein CusA [Gammaproteobacteria bacterium]|nr:Cation efflux system protein CusA [Gammaproteobacteria bacterium]